MIDYFYVDTSGFITLRGSCAIDEDIPTASNDTLYKEYAPNEYNHYENGQFYYKKQEDELRLEALVKRYRLLCESDYTQLPDVELQNKQEWAIYRQCLRDLTDQPGFPYDIIWPIKPSTGG